MYAVDIQVEMLDMLAQRVEEAELANVVPILGDMHDPKLPPASCDLILLADVYHEIGYPEQQLAGMARALKPGGRLALLEFRQEDPTVPIKPTHKMSKAQIFAELVPNGFVLDEEFDELPRQHLMFFTTKEKH